MTSEINNIQVQKLGEKIGKIFLFAFNLFSNNQNVVDDILYL